MGGTRRRGTERKREKEEEEEKRRRKEERSQLETINALVLRVTDKVITSTSKIMKSICPLRKSNTTKKMVIIVLMFYSFYHV